MGSPIFATLPAWEQGDIADASLMKALSAVGGPLAGRIQSKPCLVRRVAPPAAPLAVTLSTVPAPTKADFERQLGLVDHSWASAALMAVPTRKIDLEETHSDRRYLCPPQRAAPSILCGTAPPTERYLRLPPQPSLSSSTGAMDLTGSPSTALDPPTSGDCPFRPAMPSPRGSPSDNTGDHQPIALHGPVPSVDPSSVGGGGGSAPRRSGRARDPNGLSAAKPDNSQAGTGGDHSPPAVRDHG